MWHVSKQRPVWVTSEYFHKIFNQIWIENIKMTGQEENTSLAERKLRGKMKRSLFSNQCALLYNSQIREAVVHKYSTE